MALVGSGIGIALLTACGAGIVVTCFMVKKRKQQNQQHVIEYQDRPENVIEQTTTPTDIELQKVSLDEKPVEYNQGLLQTKMQEQDKQMREQAEELKMLKQEMEQLKSQSQKKQPLPLDSSITMFSQKKDLSKEQKNQIQTQVVDLQLK
jgi:hypothetical protein